MYSTPWKTNMAPEHWGRVEKGDLLLEYRELEDQGIYFYIIYRYIYYIYISHGIHVWYICLHLVDFYGKCR